MNAYSWDYYIIILMHFPRYYLQKKPDHEGPAVLLIMSVWVIEHLISYRVSVVLGQTCSGQMLAIALVIRIWIAV